jgi:hypothetical protein
MNVFTFEDTILDTPSYLSAIPLDITRYLKCFVFGTFFKYHETAVSGKFLYEKETKCYVKTRELWQKYRETILPHRKLKTKEMTAICLSLFDMFPTIVGRKHKKLTAILMYYILLVETDIATLSLYPQCVMALYSKIQELRLQSRVLRKYFCPRWDHLIERVWVFVDDQVLDHYHQVEEESDSEEEEELENDDEEELENDDN